MWNDKFELPDGSYSLSDIHIIIQIFWIYHQKSLIDNQKILTDNPLIRIYENKIENRITVKINTEYYLELLTPEKMELFGSTKIKWLNI